MTRLRRKSKTESGAVMTKREAVKRKPPKCTKIFLQGGTSDTDHKFLDIAPTMQNITHEGRKYFKCPSMRALDPSDGQWAMTYLWEGWGAWKARQLGIEDYPTS